MTQYKDLRIFHLYMQGCSDIQRLWYILVDSLEIYQCNLVNMNKQEGYRQFDRQNKGHKVRECKDFQQECPK